MASDWGYARDCKAALEGLEVGNSIQVGSVEAGEVKSAYLRGRATDGE